MVDECVLDKGLETGIGYGIAESDMQFAVFITQRHQTLPHGLRRKNGNSKTALFVLKRNGVDGAVTVDDIHFPNHLRRPDEIKTFQRIAGCPLEPFP